jgi:EAL domain-containing protein (putative c-di-GMP-specific phosphodiesterase class I)/GGDEF domain-containing protein
VSFVRLLWATIAAFYLGTLVVCVAVVMPSLAGDIAGGLAATSAATGQRMARSFESAALPEDATANPLTAWLPSLRKQAKDEKWAEFEVVDAKGAARDSLASAGNGWTGVLAGQWKQGRATTPLVRNGQEVGKLSLTVSTASARTHMEHAVLQMAEVFALVGVLLLLALKRLERWARKPLAGFYEQIQGLSERRFVEVKEPAITEWIGLSRSLNVMVARVRQMLEDRDEVVGNLKDKLAHDQLTRTASREAYMDGLRANLRDNDLGGGVAIIRVNDLEGMNRRLGRNRTDEFLLAVATTLRTRLMVEGSEDSYVLARLNGADFGLLVPSCDLDTWRTRLQGLANALALLVDDGLTDCTQVAWIGGTTFLRGESIPDVLTRVDAMLMAAESQQDAVCVTQPSARTYLLAIAQWRVVIETALDTGHLDLEFHPVVNAQGELLHREAMLRLIDADGHAVDADVFIPPAIRCGRISDLDLKAVELALAELAKHEGSIAVNIAAQSALRPIFHRQLLTMLSNHREVASRLLLEVREPNLASDSNRMIEGLGRTVNPFGVTIGLDHFGIHLSALPVLSNSVVRYVKLAERVTAGVATQGRMQSFVSLLADLGHQHHVQVMCMGVQAPQWVPMLAALGVQGFTGTGVKEGLPEFDAMQLSDAPA